MYRSLVCMALGAATIGGCSDKPSVSLSCSILVTDSRATEALITISSTGQTATLVWFPETGAPAWHIRGQLDNKFFRGTVDGDLGTHVSIDRTSGRLQMADSVEPIRRYSGICVPSKKVF